MQYAARLTTLPSPKTFAVPLAALVLGAAVATGAYAIADDDSAVVQEPARVIVVDTPTVGEGVSVKDEAATAAAIGTAGVELRGSKASATATSSADPEPTKTSRPGRLGPAS
jgi:hypothetical protein